LRALAGLACALGAATLTAACSNSPSPSTSTTTSTTGVTTTSTAPASTTTSASTTTTAAASSACNHLNPATGQSQGAAGTITGTITLTNTGPACVMNGYPSIGLYSTGGAALPTTVVDGLSVNVGGSANAPPSTVMLAGGSLATFTYQYSDVPSGSETSCPTSATAVVRAPGATTATARFALTIAPCSSGTVRVSPVYAAG
jgi:hypothetical protein